MTSLLPIIYPFRLTQTQIFSQDFHKRHCTGTTALYMCYTQHTPESYNWLQFLLPAPWSCAQTPILRVVIFIDVTSDIFQNQFRDVLLYSGTALQAGKSRVGFPMGSLRFFIQLILPSAL